MSPSVICKYAKRSAKKKTTVRASKLIKEGATNVRLAASGSTTDFYAENAIRMHFFSL